MPIIIKVMNKLNISAFTIFLLTSAVASAQNESPDSVSLSQPQLYVERDSAATVDNSIYIDPLFEYVVAPDDLPDLQSRTDYLMDNFWNPFDFKNTAVVDQNALNHAFKVYVETMAFASEKKIQDSVNKLLKNIKNNPGLSYQFTKAAEEALFGPRAEYWYDNMYIRFLQNLMDQKQISEGKKKRYAAQLNLLQRTAIGQPLPDFNYTMMDGTVSRFVVDKPYTLVEFTTPGSDDNRYANLKLDISSKINDMIEDGQLGVKIVLMTENVAPFTCPSKWQAAISDNASSVMDIRTLPCFYIIDSNNIIVAKNLMVDTAIPILESLTNQDSVKK